MRGRWIYTSYRVEGKEHSHIQPEYRESIILCILWEASSLAFLRGLTSYRVFIYTPEYRVLIILLWTSCFAKGKKGSGKGSNSGSYYRKACALPILTSHMHKNVHIARIPEYTCTGSRSDHPLDRRS